MADKLVVDDSGGPIRLVRELDEGDLGGVVGDGHSADSREPDRATAHGAWEQWTIDRAALPFANGNKRRSHGFTFESVSKARAALARHQGRPESEASVARMGAKSAWCWVEAAEELEWGDVKDIEERRREAVEKLRAAGLDVAANFLALKPALGDQGWRSQWHCAIQLCDEEAMGVEPPTVESIDAATAVTSLFYALCSDHEKARRCASR